MAVLAISEIDQIKSEINSLLDKTTDGDNANIKLRGLAITLEMGDIEDPKVARAKLDKIKKQFKL